MELFDRLEALEGRVTELLRHIDELREENHTLRETAIGLADLREENRALKEALTNEQRTRERIDGRIDALLARIREYTAPEADGGPGA